MCVCVCVLGGSGGPPCFRNYITVFVQLPSKPSMSMGVSTGGFL